MNKILKSIAMVGCLIFGLTFTSCGSSDRALGWDFYVVNTTGETVTVDFVFDSGDTVNCSISANESYNIYRMNWIDKGISHQKFPECEYVKAIINYKGNNYEETSGKGNSIINYSSYTYLNADESYNLHNHSFDMIKTYVFFITEDYLTTLEK